EPGDGQPDYLGQDEEDHEEHDLAAPALRVPPERRVELCHATGLEGVLHEDAVILVRSGAPTILIPARPGAAVGGHHTRRSTCRTRPSSAVHPGVARREAADCGCTPHELGPVGDSDPADPGKQASARGRGSCACAY